MTEIETRHAAEIAHDTKLAELLRAQYDAETKLAEKRQWLVDDAAAYTVHYDGRIERHEAHGRRTRVDDVPELAIYEFLPRKYTERTVHVRGAGEIDLRWNRDRYVTDIEAIEALGEDNAHVVAYVAAREAAREAREAVKVHERDYTGWNRYLLVITSNGHVHRTTACPTCRPTTRFAPVVRLAGATAEEAIAELGETLCTVCFPDAPVEGKPNKITAAKARKLAEVPR